MTYILLTLISRLFYFLCFCAVGLVYIIGVSSVTSPIFTGAWILSILYITSYIFFHFVNQKHRASSIICMTTILSLFILYYVNISKWSKKIGRNEYYIEGIPTFDGFLLTIGFSAILACATISHAELSRMCLLRSIYRG